MNHPIILVVSVVVLLLSAFWVKQNARLAFYGIPVYQRDLTISAAFLIAGVAGVVTSFVW